MKLYFYLFKDPIEAGINASGHYNSLNLRGIHSISPVLFIEFASKVLTLLCWCDVASSSFHLGPPFG